MIGILPSRTRDEKDEAGRLQLARVRAKGFAQEPLDAVPDDALAVFLPDADGEFQPVGRQKDDGEALCVRPLSCPQDLGKFLFLFEIFYIILTIFYILCI